MPPVIAPSAAKPAAAKTLAYGLLLLTLSVVSGWIAHHSWKAIYEGPVHLRLLIIMLVHPFAMAACVFCGLPGLGFTASSFVMAYRKGRHTPTFALPESAPCPR